MYKWLSIPYTNLLVVLSIKNVEGFNKRTKNVMNDSKNVDNKQ